MDSTDWKSHAAFALDRLQANEDKDAADLGAAALWPIVEAQQAGLGMLLGAMMAQTLGPELAGRVIQLVSQLGVDITSHEVLAERLRETPDPEGDIVILLDQLWDNLVPPRSIAADQLNDIRVIIGSNPGNAVGYQHIESQVNVDNLKVELDPEKNKRTHARNRYLKLLRDECLQIRLSVLGDDETRGRALQLTQVFINLSLLPRSTEQLQAYEGRLHERVETEPVEAIKVLKRGTNMVILGDPGSGKSSLVKYMVANVAGSQIREDKLAFPQLESVLPVLLELRKILPSLRADNLPPKEDPRRRRELANRVVGGAVSFIKDLGCDSFEDQLRHLFDEKKIFLVFDGLDEVPAEDRLLVRETVGVAIDLLTDSNVIITCRTRSYVEEAVFEGLDTYEIQPLDEDQITHFVEAWYTAQYKLRRVTKIELEERLPNLKINAVDARHIALAGRPMLLTVMAIIHLKKAELPRESVKLFNEAVDLLLNRWKKNDRVESKELESFLLDRENEVRGIMERLAYESHKSMASDKNPDLLMKDTLELLVKESYMDYGLAVDFLNYVDLNAGLLIGRGGSLKSPLSFSFPHRQFQEYLAGCYIMMAEDRGELLKKLASEGEFWTEAVMLGVREKIHNLRGEREIRTLANELTQLDSNTISEQRLVLWAAMMVDEISVDALKRDRSGVISGERVLTQLKGRVVDHILGGSYHPMKGLLPAGYWEYWEIRG